MSKYRIEVVPSSQKLITVLLLWGVILISAFHWQANLLPYQGLIQVVFSSAILWRAFNSVRDHAKSPTITVDLSDQGEWLYLGLERQSHWNITSKSRVTPWLLWIHLISSVDQQKAHWLIVFKDQVSERDYRRLCRAILLQQQNNS